MTDTSLYYLIATSVVVLAAVATATVRREARLISSGRCPDCAGAGAKYVHGGPDGCVTCTDGTLQSHNEFRTAMGMRPRR